MSEAVLLTLVAIMIPGLTVLGIALSDPDKALWLWRNRHMMPEVNYYAAIAAAGAISFGILLALALD